MGPSSTAQKFTPAELLHYSDTYKVLICKPCQYAIQPGALPRHLKEIHGIYRGARRPYTTHVNGLQLLDPDHVEPPSPKDFPVPHLLLEQGLRCTACGHLCASVKRMSVHWSSTHGRTGIPNLDWAAAPLQTFFRGNKLRYFSRPSKPMAIANITPDQVSDGPALLLQHVKQASDLDDIDLQITQHYLSTTYKYFIFEGTASSQEHHNIWLHTVPQIACHVPFILHEILACTAMHMAHARPSEREALMLRAMAHHEKAFPPFRRAVEAPTTENCDAILVFAYLLTILTLALDVDNSGDELLLLESRTRRLDDTNILQAPCWLHLMRHGCVMLCDVWETIETGPLALLASAYESYEDLGKGLAGSVEPYNSFFLSLIPDDDHNPWPPNIVATYRTAALSLAESFATLGQRDTKTSVVTIWSVLAMWPTRVEDTFLTLLAKRHPGALVLLAYYCVILKQLDRTWYFYGRARRLLGYVMGQLDERWYPFVQGAVEQVMGDRPGALWNGRSTWLSSIAS